MRWWVIVAAIAAVDAAAVLWGVATRSRIDKSVGGGTFQAFITYSEMMDGSSVVVVSNLATGNSLRRTVTRPATTGGLILVWWPACAAGILTFMALALALTRRGRHFVAGLLLPRMTTRRFMIATAVLGADLGWALRDLSSWRCLFYSGQVELAALDQILAHVLALIAVGAAFLLLSVRRRFRGHLREAL